MKDLIDLIPEEDREELEQLLKVAEEKKEPEKPKPIDVAKVLDEKGVRATYGTVASICGGLPRGIGKRLGDKTREASWVVNKTTGMPTGYEPKELLHLHEGKEGLMRYIKSSLVKKEELQKLLDEAHQKDKE